MGFLRVILIIVVVYYVIKLIFRYLFPIFIKKQIEKMSNKSDINSNRKEGEVIIEDKNIYDDDFVDYEEID